ncbi:MAG TPA: chromate transporter [Bacilli bacterium]|jgi:chromate transporter|nr:chromate transporter [Acholeplasmataceae bacterium]HNZ77939.1 chromate transporter [Bacilli bacterium]HPM14358.1 chromate transporter [Bacilli bacterium]HPY54405.1 chromate transporter [Bacilli bacterium]HQB95163.1 chromate transporter [Bacilli bacterium]
MILLELFYVFFFIGLLTIGGGYAMIPMIKDEVVTRGWMTMEELLNFFAIAESTPGPFAVNTATMVGFSQAGIVGAIVATLSVVLPSFIIILIIAKYITNFLKYKQVKWALDGVKPIVVGLIVGVVLNLIANDVLGLTTVLDLFNKSLVIETIDYMSLIIMIAMFLLKMKFKKLSPIFMIIISAVLGIIIYGFIL